MKMYSKPQVIIDFEEYTQLLLLKEELKHEIRTYQIDSSGNLRAIGINDQNMVFGTFTKEFMEAYNKKMINIRLFHTYDDNFCR